MYVFRNRSYVPLVFHLSIWIFLSTSPTPSLYWTSLTSLFSVRLNSFLVIFFLLFFQISLSFDHVHSFDLFVLWSACISDIFSLYRCPVWRKCLLFAFCYFSPKRLCLHSFHASDFLCVHMIYSLSILFSRVVFYTSLCPVFSFTLFRLLSIDIILPYPSDFPRHFPSVDLPKSVYFPPVPVLTYTHHTLTEHFFGIISHWDFYWNFIPWVISLRHCWQHIVLYPTLCRVLYTYGV
jgi:hypothetical protein